MQRTFTQRRPAGRLGRHAYTACGVLALSLILGMSFQLDGPADFDYSAEWQRADNLVERQNAQAALQRKELAGQAACEDLRGVNVTASFDADGALYCAGGRTTIKAAL